MTVGNLGLRGVCGRVLPGLVLGVLALPASAFTIYGGGGFVGSFSGCEAQGWNDPRPVVVQVTPSGLPGNPFDSTGVVMHFGVQTHVYILPDGADNGEWADVEAWGISVGQPWNITDPQVRVRLIGWASDFLEDEDDPDMSVHGLIENFNGLAGCSARFGLTLRRLPG